MERMVGVTGHVGRMAVLVLVGVLMHWTWVQRDLVPPRDFPGYAAAIEHVRTDVALYGRVPTWCPRTDGGAPHFTSTLKEHLAAPWVARWGAIQGTKRFVVLLRIVAALSFYAVAAHLLGSGTAALVAAGVYAYGPKATDQAVSGHLDVVLFFALLPPLLLATVRCIDVGSWGWRLLLGMLMAIGLRVSPIPSQCALVLVAALLLVRPPLSGIERPSLVRATTRIAWAAVLGGVLALAPMLWMLLDAPHHALHPIRGGDEELAVLSTRSPLTLFNRDGWMTAWSWRVAAPYARSTGDPSVVQANYVGGGVLAVILVGLTRLGGDGKLRAYAIATAATALVQLLLALGPWSLVTAIMNPTSKPPSAVALAPWVVRGLGIVLAAIGMVAWWLERTKLRTRRWALPCLLAGGGCLIASVPVFLWGKSLVPFWANLRAPGHFIDTLPFCIAWLLAVALVAVERTWFPSRAWCAVLATGMALVTVLDFWPTVRALEEGRDERSMVASTEHLRERLPDDPSLRVLANRSEARFASLALSPLPIGEAMNWVAWAGSPHWGELVGGPSSDERLRPSWVLRRLGRIAYRLRSNTDPDASALNHDAVVPSLVVYDELDVYPFAWMSPQSIVVVALDDEMTRDLADVVGFSAVLISGAATILGTPQATFAGAWRIVSGPSGWQGTEGMARSPRILDVETFQRLWPVIRPRGARPWPVPWRRLAPEWIHLNVRSGRRRSFAVVAESYHPWWRATMSGVAIPVHRAQLALMAVSVPPGVHDVQLRFEPPPILRFAIASDPFLWCLAAGWLGVAAVRARTARAR